MAKRSKNPRRQEALAPLAEPIPRVATRRATADRKLRTRERLTSGLSVGHIARVEQLTVQRVRQIIAEMLEKSEVYPPEKLVQLQIACVGEAMVVAHTMMMQGDLQAMDRLMKLNGELDRYHGFGRAQLAPRPRQRRPASSCHRARCWRRVRRSTESEENFHPAKP
jgi:hypothetical protein